MADCSMSALQPTIKLPIGIYPCLTVISISVARCQIQICSISSLVRALSKEQLGQVAKRGRLTGGGQVTGTLTYLRRGVMVGRRTIIAIEQHFY